MIKRARVIFEGLRPRRKKSNVPETLRKANETLEPEAKLAWELETGVRRLGLRNLPGKKPKWHLTAETGKMTIERKKGGLTGIDIRRILEAISDVETKHGGKLDGSSSEL